MKWFKRKDPIDKLIAQMRLNDEVLVEKVAITIVRVAKPWWLRRYGVLSIEDSNISFREFEKEHPKEAEESRELARQIIDIVELHGCRTV